MEKLVLCSAVGCSLNRKFYEVVDFLHCKSVYSLTFGSWTFLCRIEGGLDSNLSCLENRPLKGYAGSMFGVVANLPNALGSFIYPTL
jgi:hypothetical protein